MKKTENTTRSADEKPSPITPPITKEDKELQKRREESPENHHQPGKKKIS